MTRSFGVTALVPTDDAESVVGVCVARIDAQDLLKMTRCPIAVAVLKQQVREVMMGALVVGIVAQRLLVALARGDGVALKQQRVAQVGVGLDVAGPDPNRVTKLIDPRGQLSPARECLAQVVAHDRGLRRDPYRVSHQSVRVAPDVGLLTR